MNTQTTLSKMNQYSFIVSKGILFRIFLNSFMKWSKIWGCSQLLSTESEQHTANFLKTIPSRETHFFARNIKKKRKKLLESLVPKAIGISKRE
jgi:hypothetical protein